MMRRHAELLVRDMGEERGCREFRKHIAWYLKGFARRRRSSRGRSGWSSTLAELDGLLAELDLEQPFPLAELGAPRGRQGGPRRSPSRTGGWTTVNAAVRPRVGRSWRRPLRAEP